MYHSWLQAVAQIGNEEGIAGFWKGNVPQVLDRSMSSS